MRSLISLKFAKFEKLMAFDIALVKCAEHSVHRTPAAYAGAGGGSLRVFEPFSWLWQDSVSEPSSPQPPLTQAVGRQKRKLVIFVFQDVSWLTIQCFADRLQSG